MTKSGLEDIGRNYFKREYISELLPLQDISCFKQFFCKYLQEQRHVKDDDLDESFRRWCNQLSSGRAPLEVRRIVVFSLWIHCSLKQIHIARLLGVSTRTIRRDQRAIHHEIGKSGLP
ncbi:MAG: hypothetical protein COA77_07290 [Thaumarchaeota archaeon]|nr:MAG: hypothetical protein COA77_07290 [Nitrososphaerota archaeon]